ncbi:DsbA family protein [Vibrio nereis]|uniref:DsbA family protein n=1 Tax=Vibrio nereis TaxID=693 RepID=UPI0024945AE4|nr:thioredoxin domain-containing protein [Vibrio nereis]
MKNTIPLVVACTILSGCSTTSSQDIELLQAKVKDLETNQRIIASRIQMDGVTGTPDSIDFDDGIAFGSPKAPIAMIEFTDIQCPYCAQFQEETFPEFKDKYIDTGKVYYVAREMPLGSIHPKAFSAAVALRCAAEQDKAVYESMKVDLFKQRNELSEQVYLDTATSYALDTQKFSSCVSDKDTQKSVENSYKYAISIGIKSTPSFVFGHNTGSSAADYKIGSGAMSLEQIENALALFSEEENQK